MSKRFSELTTLRVGGEIVELVTPKSREEYLAVLLDTVSNFDDFFLLGGGSNLVASDFGFDSRVIRPEVEGIEQLTVEQLISEARPGITELLNSRGITGAQYSNYAVVRVQAGQNWDSLVAWTVANGFRGIEALSGIPGSVGAAPVQNIGAYGTELSETLLGIEFFDYQTAELVYLVASELNLSYRSSVIKQGRAGAVVTVDLLLEHSKVSGSVKYQQLAQALGVELGAEVELAQLRNTVLALRASKGMVSDENDPDSVSAGSFFTNPYVSESFAASLPAEAPRWKETKPETDYVWPLGAPPPLESEQAYLANSKSSAQTLVKLSAAWLIENSGIPKGYSLPGSKAAVSSKHTLALINTGSATAEEIVQLARFIQSRVLSEFGVLLQAEPKLLGLSL